MLTKVLLSVLVAVTPMLSFSGAPSKGDLKTKTWSMKNSPSEFMDKIGHFCFSRDDSEINVRGKSLVVKESTGCVGELQALSKAWDKNPKMTIGVVSAHGNKNADIRKQIEAEYGVLPVKGLNYLVKTEHCPCTVLFGARSMEVKNSLIMKKRMGIFKK